MIHILFEGNNELVSALDRSWKIKSLKSISIFSQNEVVVSMVLLVVREVVVHCYHFKLSIYSPTVLQFSFSKKSINFKFDNFFNLNQS
jgi:hypothetical protein